MLHLTGNFKIWKPKPKVIKDKEMEAKEINGVAYKAGDTIDWFEDCELYKVTFKAAAQPPKDTAKDTTDAIRNMFMRADQFKMQRDYNLKGCKVNSENRARGAYYGRKVQVK
jgi:oligosaccharide reducing-end xylanase